MSFGPYFRRQKTVGSTDLCVPGQCWNSANQGNEDYFAYPCNQPESSTAQMGAAGFLGKQAVL